MIPAIMAGLAFALEIITKYKMLLCFNEQSVLSLSPELIGFKLLGVGI